MIYFVQAPEYKVLKIGLTANQEKLKRRLETFIVACPTETVLFGTIDHISADISLEIELHKRFMSRHKRGEWFYYDDDLLLEISGLPHFTYAKVLPKPRRHATNSQPLELVREVDRLLKQGGLSNTQIAQRTGMSLTSVTRIKWGQTYSDVTGRTKRKAGIQLGGDRTVEPR